MLRINTLKLNDLFTPKDDFLEGDVVGDGCFGEGGDRGWEMEDSWKKGRE